ncbi:hypothetical protein [Methanoculleus sp. MH98A]|uniref:hypothetical protein n=1 Tax=Methanoculleus sp. MH98A TaxID=1495314 RepID=UPI00350F2E55
MPDVIPNGNLLMANRADELLLYRGTTLVQQIAWPGDVRPREGRFTTSRTASGTRARSLSVSPASSPKRSRASR